MTGLTELHLANNIIDKIENLDYLVNLTNLDLSFNRIKVIENLEVSRLLLAISETGLLFIIRYYEEPSVAIVRLVPEKCI